MNRLEKLLEKHNVLKLKIRKRLEEFLKIWKEKNHKKIFKEAVFCLLTPQSRARVCWKAVVDLEENGLLWKGRPEEIANYLKGVRFKNNKAGYIVELREKYWKGDRFTLIDSIKNLSAPEAREWLVRNIKGMGYKEASHFLRNIGFSLELAILDRHILKNLLFYGAIEKIPASISRKKYLTIEESMREFSRKIAIPMGELDLLFWAIQTGEIFK